MRCVAIDGNGFVVDVVPQPADVTTCSMVLASPEEIGEASPFNIPLDAAGDLVAAMGLVIATGWIYRLLIRNL